MPERQFEVFSTTDKPLLRNFLLRHGAAAAYLLGDLDEKYFHTCNWFVGTYRERPHAVVAVFQGLSEPALLTCGAPDAVQAIIAQSIKEMPHECHAKIAPDHEAHLSGYYDVVNAEPHWMMALDIEEFVSHGDSGDVRKLGPEDLADMMSLYERQPTHFFASDQLETELFFGRYLEGSLVAIAGTQAYSPSEHVAVLGNFVTDPAARRKGHFSVCFRLLAQTLLDEGCSLIALQVSAQNGSAIAAYRTLGFSYRNSVLQARLASSVNAAL